MMSGLLPSLSSRDLGRCLTLPAVLPCLSGANAVICRRFRGLPFDGRGSHLRDPGARYRVL